MIPIIELRGAIPAGFASGMSWYANLISSVIGNCIVIPFVMLLTRPVFLLLSKKLKIIGWIEERVNRKVASVNDKIWYSALFVFVAVPLPGTGAWTGSMVAAVMGIPVKRATPVIALGVLAAGIVVTLITYGLGTVIPAIFA